MDEPILDRSRRLVKITLINSIPELTGRCCPHVQFGIGRAYRVHHQDESVRPRTVLRLPNQPSGGGYHLSAHLDNDTAYVGASNHCVSHHIPMNEDLSVRPFRLGDSRRSACEESCASATRSSQFLATGQYLQMECRFWDELRHRQASLVATGTRRDGFTTAPYIVAQTLIDERAWMVSTRFHHCSSNLIVATFSRRRLDRLKKQEPSP